MQGNASKRVPALLYEFMRAATILQVRARHLLWELGKKVRELLERHGFRSVAGEDYQAPGVVVYYTDDPEIQNGSKFRAQGLQIAAGVPLMCGEPPDFRTFRVGLFGLEKLRDTDRAVAPLAEALERITDS